MRSAASPSQNPCIRERPESRIARPRAVSVKEDILRERAQARARARMVIAKMQRPVDISVTFGLGHGLGLVHEGCPYMTLTACVSE